MKGMKMGVIAVLCVFLLMWCCESVVPLDVRFSSLQHILDYSSDGSILMDKIISVDQSTGWMRLFFSELNLPSGVLLTLTSLKDGAQQHFDQSTAKTWAKSSAFFNGNSIRITISREEHPLKLKDLTAYKKAFSGFQEHQGEQEEEEEAGAGAGAGSALREVRVIVQEIQTDSINLKGIQSSMVTDFIEEMSICYNPDTRVLSNDTRQGRYIPSDPNGCCTAWMIDDESFCFLSAGHCTDSGRGLVEFNVPFSDDNGTLLHPAPKDQYIVDQESMQFEYAGAGDWRYFGVFRNSETGLHPIEAYSGQYYKLKRTNTPVGSTIRITGFGENESFPKNERRILKTANGPFVSQSSTAIRYRTDTSNGNSGSAIYDEEQDVAIGVHTLGGCSISSQNGYNSGTNIFLTNLQNALNGPRGVCSFKGNF